MTKKVVGIIGGMGPEATVDFMQKIIKNTPVELEQDHLHILVDNNPEIPCRVKAILDGGSSPVPVLLEMAKRLEKSGAEILAIPCNTVHYYIEEIKKAVNIPVLNMIEETANTLKEKGSKEVYLISSSAVLETRLYEKAFKNVGIKIVLPDALYQEEIMEAIFAVKAGKFGKARTLLQEVINHLLNKGEKEIVIGCTDLPLVLGKDILKKVYDPGHILALKVVEKALNIKEMSL